MAHASAVCWSGRDDGPGAEHARWHSVVRPRAADSGPSGSGSPQNSEGGGGGVHLLGFGTDEGVRRNGGRTGAAQGPAALRRVMANGAVHGVLGSGAHEVIDHGDVLVEAGALEPAQEAAGCAVAAALDAAAGGLAIVLGGGHEVAWSSYLGLRASHLLSDPSEPVRWGVLNLDAHFDLRSEDRATSGTPFLQMAEAERDDLRGPLNYAVLGIAEPSNTSALFARARDLGVRWMTDVECAEAGPAGVRRFVEEFSAGLDVLYLTVDLDVLPAAVAPGVSAPAALGVDPASVLTAVRAAASSGKLRLMDVVELNPALDADQRTARTGARVIDEAVRTMYDIHA